MPVLFLHASFQPALGSSFGSTRVELRLSDLAVLAIGVAAALGARRDGVASLRQGRAVWVAAVLFASAHIPNPVLTVATLLGALFFCEMFLRYRSIYPLGIVHAMLELSLAASFPDALLRHMRVGLGYLQFH